MQSQPPPRPLPKEDRAPTRQEARQLWRTRPVLIIAVAGALLLAGAVTYGCNMPGAAEAGAGYVPILAG